MHKNFIVLCEYEIINGSQEHNVKSFCKIFRELGYSCHTIGFNHQSDSDLHWVDDAGTSWHIFGVKVYGNPVKRRILRYFKQRDVLNASGLFQNAEIVLCIPWWRSTILKKLQKIYGFKIISSVCELFDAKRYFGFSGKIKSCKDFIDKISRYIDDNYSRRYAVVKNKNIIAVSKKIEEYYKKKNCHVLRMPNLIEPEKLYTPAESENGVLTLGYFGNPEKHNLKDLFNNVVKGLALLNDDEKRHVKFHVYGINKNDGENNLEKLYDIDKKTQDAVKDVMIIHGRIDKDKVKQELQKCDFTVLLRESTYSLNCGLPSKMTETLAYGVPMICNLTSNMDEYLSDGYNAIISPSKEPEDFVECVRRAMKLTPDEKKIYKINAYESGKKYFDWRNYVEPMKNFIAEIL